MTKSSVARINRKLMNKKENVTDEVYVTSAKDYETAKELALLIAPKLEAAAEGNYLIQLQALDILQDLIGLQAIQARNKLKQEKLDEANQGS